MPIVLANLVSVGQVLVTYRDNLESVLVELPQGTADVQAIGVANLNTKQDYKGAFLSFNLNLNWPPPCTTGFLPAQQQRAASYEDYPDPPRVMSTAGCRRTPSSTCAARATCRARPDLVSEPRP
ncbi:MCE-family Mce3F domain protein [Mycobacterium xenopi 4042]|uniref:MCE-family Mce3F domain protein n=1 Tax=Mycobacterium xenopi 4042 TaxID=1299334 RepID=X7ZWV8_MYCXE|nr:MCE-family Mce3F domain protein [Mycobacterium xenopi 4042]